ncbi:autotransporter outer membrane beta-barrel domain-containing protein [Fundidesulfovibrio putealis]|uniref:autotransporter outer membrane beta-barrel domain-containing protein n=1 Tax=Fundidesulfovibrio putealis TaxID=270496 RepID=UPI0004289699|nr:autotransporter domain-containing protein [Fundidesulfovibrio putealis]
MKRFACVAALLAAIAFANAAPASAAGKFNQLIGLGDSTLDTGYFRYTSSGNAAVNAALVSAIAAGAQGEFAGPGVMTTTMLGGRFGLSAEPSSAGGTIYANGSAYSALLGAVPGGPTIPGSLPGNVATTQQIARYLASGGGAANPNALYVINTGNNDLIFVQNQGPAWIAANPDFLGNVASQLALSVAALQAAGARTIMVPNTFYTSALTGLGGVLPASNADSYARAIAYGNTKWANLAAAGVRFIPADLTSMFRFVSANPALFGFTPSSVLASNAPSPVAALVTSWDDVTPAQMQTYLFIDGKHLTTAGQQIEADYEHSLLTAPTQMSLLAEGPVQGGLARAATIQGQIDLSGQHRGDNGINVWASGGVNSLQMKSYTGFAESSGTPFTGAVGADYQTSFGLILGAAFAAGTQTQDFSEGAGHYDQNDQAFSLYTAYKYGPVWGNAVASYGLYQDTIKRSAPLGLFTDQNSADTTGDSLGLALRLGADLKLGPVTTGPVAGLVLQQVRIKAFTESGTSGVTALHYGEQQRDSAVTQLGWRVLADIGRWQPFVEAKWSHELADPKRTVKASLTTTSAPAYSMDAVPVTTDWGTVMLGTSFKVNDRVMLRASFSSMFSNPQVATYGGELGVNVSF